MIERLARDREEGVLVIIFDEGKSLQEIGACIYVEIECIKRKIYFEVCANIRIVWFRAAPPDY